jgi:hypothetical protein
MKFARVLEMRCLQGSSRQQRSARPVSGATIDLELVRTATAAGGARWNRRERSEVGVCRRERSANGGPCTSSSSLGPGYWSTARGFRFGGASPLSAVEANARFKKAIRRGAHDTVLVLRRRAAVAEPGAAAHRQPRTEIVDGGPLSVSGECLPARLRCARAAPARPCSFGDGLGRAVQLEQIQFAHPVQAVDVVAPLTCAAAACLCFVPLCSCPLAASPGEHPMDTRASKSTHENGARGDPWTSPHRRQARSGGSHPFDVACYCMN